MDEPSPRTPHPFPRPEREARVPVVEPAELGTPDSRPGTVLIDVRPGAERARARIPGDVHLPLEELPRRLGELPRDAPLVVYSQHGQRATRAAEHLLRSGFSHVAVLAGGIDRYALEIDPTLERYEDPEADRLYLRQLPRPASGCLAYLVGDPHHREAIVLDPGREVEPYLALLASGRWHLAGIVETHTHADHLAGHAALAARTGAPIYLSRRSPAQYPHRTLSDGEALPFGAQELRVWETPGHTRDHLTLRVGSKMFTGDTLLLGSCGRTDLGDGSPDALWESLTDRILTAPDETEVLPAHFGRHHALPERYASTLGFERGTNEALTTGSREAFLRYMTEGWPPKPVDFDRIVRENLDR